MIKPVQSTSITKLCTQNHPFPTTTNPQTNQPTQPFKKPDSVAGSPTCSSPAAPPGAPLSPGAGILSGGSTSQQRLRINPQRRSSASRREDGVLWSSSQPFDSARTGPHADCSSPTTCSSPHMMSRDGSYANLAAPPAAASPAAPTPLSSSSFSASAGSPGQRGADAASRSKLAEQHHARGYAARKQGRFDVAVEEYSRTLALEPRHFKALFNRGFSYDKVSLLVGREGGLKREEVGGKGEGLISGDDGLSAEAVWC